MRRAHVTINIPIAFILRAIGTRGQILEALLTGVEALSGM